MLTVSYAVICTVTGCVIGILTFLIARKKDFKEKTEEDVAVQYKIEEIYKNSNEMKTSLGTLEKEFSSMKETQIKHGIYIENLQKDVETLKHEKDKD